MSDEYPWRQTVESYVICPYCEHAGIVADNIRYEACEHHRPHVFPSPLPAALSVEGRRTPAEEEHKVAGPDKPANTQPSTSSGRGTLGQEPEAHPKLFCDCGECEYWCLHGCPMGEHPDVSAKRSASEDHLLVSPGGSPQLEADEKDAGLPGTPGREDA